MRLSLGVILSPPRGRLYFQSKIVTEALSAGKKRVRGDAQSPLVHELDTKNLVTGTVSGE